MFYNCEYLYSLFFVWFMFSTAFESFYVLGGKIENEAATKVESVCKVPSDGLRIDVSKYIYINKKFHWEGCRDYCKKNGLEIASIKSLKEQEFLEKFVHTYMQKGEYPEKNSSVLYGTFWFGANDYNTQGSFRWINGEEIEYQKFWYHNPNNNKKYTKGKYGEHCTEFMYFPNTTESWWNDQYCGQKKPFFCEYPYKKFECYSVPSYAEPIKVPELNEVENTGIYHSGTLQLNWVDAFNFCEDEGLSLASIHDTEAVNSISNVVKKDDNLYTHYWTNGVFSAGCCDPKTLQYDRLHFLTMDESLNSGSLKYLNWWKVEPSDEGGIREENCVEFLHVGKGKIEFSARHFSLPYPFLCTKKLGWACRCSKFVFK